MIDQQKEQKEYDNEDAASFSTFLLVFGILGFIISFVLIFIIPLVSITVAIMSATLTIASILIRINHSVKRTEKT